MYDKHLTLFESTEEYLSYLNSGQLIEPNVTFIKNVGVKYHSLPEEDEPEVSPKLTMTFTVKEGESLTFNNLPNNTKSLSIDGAPVDFIPANIQTVVNNCTVDILGREDYSDLQTPEGTTEIIIETINSNQEFNDATKMHFHMEGGIAYLTIGDIVSVEPNFFSEYTSNKIVLRSAEGESGILMLFFNEEEYIETKQTYIVTQEACHIENDVVINDVGEHIFELGVEDTSLVTFNYPKSQLTSVSIEGVETIGYHLFSACTNLVSVSLDDRLINIDSSVFYGCTNLTVIILPHSLQYIGNYAFENCSSLTDITIPDSVTYVGDKAFSGCTSLPIIDNIRYADTYVIEAVDKTQETYTIKDGTKFIGGSAFFSCSLTSIVIPDTVVLVGTQSFAYCKKLNTINLPQSLKTIEDYAFRDSGLKSIEIPNLVESIMPYTFYNCDYLTSIVLGENISEIGAWAFADCSIQTINFSNKLQYIGVAAFYGCQDLIGEIIIPDSVTSIGMAAFNYCKGLTSVVIGNGVRTISDSAFTQCTNLSAIEIPESVTSIGGYAFYNCNLLSLEIPDSVKTVGDFAFVFNKITSAYIGSGVTSIGDCAFGACTALISITSTSVNAPEITSETFSSIASGGTLYCPSGSDYSSWMQTGEYYLGYYDWNCQEIS